MQGFMLLRINAQLFMRCLDGDNGERIVGRFLEYGLGKAEIGKGNRF